MPFGVVSGVGPGIHELDGVHVPQGEGAVSGMVSGIFRHLRPIRLNGRNDVLYSTRMCKIDNISVRTIYRWNLSFILAI